MFFSFFINTSYEVKETKLMLDSVSRLLIIILIPARVSSMYAI